MIISARTRNPGLADDLDRCFGIFLGDLWILNDNIAGLTDVDMLTASTL